MQSKPKNLINYTGFEDQNVFRKMQILKQLKQSKESQESSKMRYKTEICRSFKDNNMCKYGEKCQFAHGEQQLRNVNRHEKFKTELCRRFHQEGYCPYGPRCHFIHDSVELIANSKKQLNKEAMQNELNIGKMASMLNVSLCSSNELLNFKSISPQSNFSVDTTTSSFGSISGPVNQDFFHDSSLASSTPKPKQSLRQFELNEAKTNTSILNITSSSASSKSPDCSIQDSSLSSNSRNNSSPLVSNYNENFVLNSSAANFSPPLNDKKNNDLVLETDNLSSRLDYIINAFLKSKFFM